VQDEVNLNQEENEHDEVDEMKEEAPEYYLC